MKPDRDLKNNSRKPKTQAPPARPAITPAALPPPAPKLILADNRAKTAPTTVVFGAGNQTRSVTIEAKIDVGFGNSLYLRGEGHGLSWERGIPLTCVDASTWKWCGPAKDLVKFKLLLNDSVWSKGEDLVAKPGEKLEVVPAF